MLQFADLLVRVLQATGRPDQEAWAVDSLNACIREVARSADYPQDLYETEFYADPINQSVMSGPIKIAIPLLADFLVAPLYEAVIRKVAYLAYDNQKLTEVTPHNLLLANCPEQDVFYRNGQNQLVINPSKSYDKFVIGVYCLPTYLTSTIETDYWLLDSASEILIIGTMAKVYKNTGDDASHDRYYAEYVRLLRQFKLDNVNSGVI